MLGKKLWLYNDVPDAKAREISDKAGISILLAKIFLSRGISDINYIQRFLNPTLDGLHDPFLMKDMDKAVERIIRAITKKEKIVIYGDYDVDGTTSTSVISNFLERLGVESDHYIPDRLEEGYGLSIGAIDKISNSHASLIITVDCGITAIDEVKYTIEKGMDIIVTDHHQCKDILPDAFAVIDPCRPDCNYPFKQLAGVGVAYKLLTALCIRMGLGDIYNDYLDIVALGTVADVVPLIDENRIIVKYGIKKLEQTENVGLKALINCAGFRDKPISSFGISFGLAPRINAAGRIGDASRAVKLFTTEDEQSARSIAEELNDENKLRQDTEMWIMQQVMEIIKAQINLEKEKVIVVAGEGWHHGVIGIVASKITEKYYRPCILLTCEEGMCKGSGRSIEGFNLFNALSHCEDLLEKFGGHELAAGLALTQENLHAFRKMINEYADEVLTGEDLIPRLKIDISLNKSDLSMQSIREIDMLAPFGAGNPGPVFVYNGLRVGNIKTVGENRHLKLKLVDGSFFADAIGFNMGGIAEEIKCNDIMDVACSLEINTWNSVDKIQLNLRDIKFTSIKQIEHNFYSSLHNCIKTEAGELEVCSLEAVKKCAYSIETQNEFIDIIKSEIDKGKNIAVMVNDISCIELIDKILKNSHADIKDFYKICYTSSNGDITEKVSVIVNPAANLTDFNFYSVIIVFGNWIDLKYLRELVNCIDKHKLFLYNIGIHNFNNRDIILERNDLAAIYQYIRNSCVNPVQIDDMNSAADEIADSYKLVMNYFKFRQGLEVFEELGLISKKYYGLHGVSISMSDNIKTKTNLENSPVYRRLQALKGQLKGG